MHASKMSLMKASKTFLIACAILSIPLSSRAAQTAPAPQKQAPPAPSMPKESVFVIPVTAQQGMRDPFFPNSTRLFKTPVALAPNHAPATVHVKLKLNGLSGSPENRLAMINGKTFATGEEGEVNTPNGRVSVHVLDISADGARVECNGELQELKLKD